MVAAEEEQPRSDEELVPNLEKWQYETAPDERQMATGGFFSFCVSRPKPGSVEVPMPLEEENEHEIIWDTANLSWWDFQRRRWKTLWLMRTIYNRYKRLQADTEQMTPDSPEVNELWEDCHKLSATEMRMHAEEAKGLFIKAGQAMSAMVGQMPDHYTNQFLSLTDHLPVSTIEEVYRTIQKDFGRPPKDIFSEFDSKPLASASIAQVHRARLRSTGEVVAVKVQHDGVDRIFLEDIGTLNTVANQVAFWSPDLDFRKFAEEWGDSLPRELDFTHERRALERAGNALREARNPCIVPKVVSDLHAQHVFVMEFVEAGPILAMEDSDFCNRNGVIRHQVLTELLDAFAIMAFKDGLFHADPHAGNVRLKLDPSAPGGARAVLLDWGLFREVSDEERMGLAKVFHSLANFDISGLFDVLQSLGFCMKTELTNDTMKRDLIEKARGVMKDTITRSQTRENARQERAEWEARIEAANKTGNADKASYSPIYFLEDWPSCIIFFLRMLQILRGLCVACNGDGMPILQIFAKHAREALQEGSRKQMLTNRLQIFAGRNGRRPAEDGGSSPRVQTELDSVLEGRLRATLESLLSKKKLVGAQVAIIHSGRLVCDLAVGTLSTIDARPVEQTTRFPLLGAAAGIASLALLRSIRRSADQLKESPSDGPLLQTPVTRIWPQFCGGHSDITLAQLLSHSVGLQDAFPDDFKSSSLDDLPAMVQHLENEGVVSESGTRYAYILQAFALAKLGGCLTPQDELLHWIGSELGPLGLDAALPAGRGQEASVCRDLPQLARVSMNEVSSARARRRSQVSSETEQVGGSAGSRSPAEGKKPWKHSLLQALAADPLTFDPLQGNSNQGGLFRGGLSIGASARGLAELLASQELQDDLAQLQALELAGFDKSAIGWMLTGGATQFTAGGLQALQLRPRGAKALLGRRQGGYGVVSGFGPVVAHFPDLAPGGVTVAVLVNDVLHGRSAAAQIVTAALEGFSMVPAWPEVTMNVLTDAAQLARSPELAPKFEQFGGIEGLTKLFDLQTGEHEQAGAGGPGLEKSCLQQAGSGLLRCVSGCSAVCQSR